MSKSPEEFLQIDLRGLANFIMLSKTDVVLVDGAHGLKDFGKNHVIQELQDTLPASVRYEAALQHEAVSQATGAILGPHRGLDVGQARLGALDFLEQVPVDQTVLFDRSPLSSVVYEPGDKSSDAEVQGWLHRIRHGRLRQMLVLVLHESATGGAAEAQKSLEDQVESILPAGGCGTARLHVFIARTAVEDRRVVCRVRARYLTTSWNYR